MAREKLKPLTFRLLSLENVSAEVLDAVEEMLDQVAAMHRQQHASYASMAKSVPDGGEMLHAQRDYHQAGAAALRHLRGLWRRQRNARERRASAS